MTDRPIYQKPSWRRWRRRPTLNRRLGFLAGGTVALAVVGAVLGRGIVRSPPDARPGEAVVDSGGDRPSLLSALRALTGRSGPSTGETGVSSSAGATPPSTAAPPPAKPTSPPPPDPPSVEPKR